MHGYMYVHMYVLTPDGVCLRIFGAAAAQTQLRACLCARENKACFEMGSGRLSAAPTDRCGSRLSRADYYECAEGVWA